MLENTNKKMDNPEKLTQLGILTSSEKHLHGRFMALRGQV
jgi:hypothetical protein